MKNRLTRITSMLLLSITMLLSSASLMTPVAAAEGNTLTVILTNDMHGRLNEVPRDSATFGKHTLLTRLKYYVDTHQPALVVDGGDAVQGLPISNINKGEHMLDAMIDIGYDMMTAGNHEFDFGYDRTMEIKAYLDANGQGMEIISSNVMDPDGLGFKPYKIVEKDGKKIAIIGLTTPETVWKTHPDNTVGLDFLEPFSQTEFYVNEITSLHTDIDLFVPVGHLGTDSETPDEWRGDRLAEHMSTYLKDEGIDIPLLMVDGHSHTTEEERYGDNVLYVQTGEYINNVGHVEIDLDNFGNSTAELIPTQTITPTEDYAFKLPAEIAAEEEFAIIGGEVLKENLPYRFNGSREYNRTRETNLGNLITDAMIAYGKGLNEKPDLAVMNGGGIREDLEPGVVTKGDAIAVIPFGNLYASIKVTGQDITDMFEHSLRTPLDKNKETGEYIKDELDNYLLGSNGGFLQVSSTAKIQYNPLNEPGNRVEKIMIDRANGWEELKLEETYVLATNDFLAQGGDGYTMLGGQRTEGESLDDVFAMYLNNELVDWELYKDEYNPKRILQGASLVEVNTEALDSLIAVVEAKDLDAYTLESVEALNNELSNAKALLESNNLTQELVDAQVVALQVAHDALVEKTPVVDYNTALTALRKADASRNSEDIALAKELAHGMKDGWQKNRIVNRLGIIEAQELERAAYNKALAAVRKADASRSKEDRVAARTLVLKLNNGSGKTQLMNRLLVIEEQEDKTSAYDVALTALRKADASRNADDIEVARNLASMLSSGWQKTRLENRLAVIDAQEA